MPPLVTVITPSLPERSELLKDARACVAGQTLQPSVVHLWALDRRRRGPAVVRNRLLRMVESEWVAFLDDDDLIDSDHLERLHSLAVETDADLVASWWRWSDEPGPFVPPRPTKLDPAALRRENSIPVTVVARTRAVIDAGGFDRHDRYEDWRLWIRMLDAGCRFEILPRVTWTYRNQVGGRSDDAPATWKQRVRYVRRRIRDFR